MPEYPIADVEVTNPPQYEKYRTLAATAIAKHGGRDLVRGGAHTALEGEWRPHRLVIVEFADVASARDFRTAFDTRNFKRPAEPF